MCVFLWRVGTDLVLSVLSAECTRKVLSTRDRECHYMVCSTQAFQGLFEGPLHPENFCLGSKLDGPVRIRLMAYKRAPSVERHTSSESLPFFDCSRKQTFFDSRLPYVPSKSLKALPVPLEVLLEVLLESPFF